MGWEERENERERAFGGENYLARARGALAGGIIESLSGCDHVALVRARLPSGQSSTCLIAEEIAGIILAAWTAVTRLQR